MIWGYVQGLRARYGAQAIGAPPEHKFTPTIIIYLEKVILGARVCRVSPSDPRGELVVTRNEIEYRVDLGANSCSCPYWRELQVPCYHAVAAIGYRDQEERRDRANRGLPRGTSPGWSHLIPRWATYEAWRSTYRELMP
jgi:SWIM zinc finger